MKKKKQTTDELLKKLAADPIFEEAKKDGQGCVIVAPRPRLPDGRPTS
jgi:hypothetical protein